MKMTSRRIRQVMWSSVAALALTGGGQATAAPLVVNGGFEAGLAGWTRVDAPGSDGMFLIQTGTSSPLSGQTVPAPPEGVRAAMSDAQGPGAHVLYQDVLVPTSIGTALLEFDLFVGNRAIAFFTPSPATLDFTPALNQQARVDILRAGTNPFSVLPSDVLQNVFQTNPGNPLVSGYSTFTIDLTALLMASAGQTLRLRFAEVDNVAAFQLGVDQVSLETDATAIPEPTTILLLAAGIAALRLRQFTSGRRESR